MSRFYILVVPSYIGSLFQNHLRFTEKSPKTLLASPSSMSLEVPGYILRKWRLMPFLAYFCREFFPQACKYHLIYFFPHFVLGICPAVPFIPGAGLDHVDRNQNTACLQSMQNAGPLNILHDTWPPLNTSAFVL